MMSSACGIKNIFFVAGHNCFFGISFDTLDCQVLYKDFLRARPSSESAGRALLPFFPALP